VGCIWSRSSPPRNPSSTCWGPGSGQSTSTTTAWDGRWTGCMHSIRRRCSPGLRSKPAAGPAVPRQVHVDTTSFATSDEYLAEEPDAKTIAVTYGYSRDDRAELATVDAGAGHHPAGGYAASSARCSTATPATM